jgi:Rieske Fe-S protein
VFEHLPYSIAVTYQSLLSFCSTTLFSLNRITQTFMSDHLSDVSSSSSAAAADSSRRDFLKTLATGTAMVCGGSLLSCLAACGGDDSNPAGNQITGQTTTLTLSESANSALQNVGGFIRRTFGSGSNTREMIVIRTTQTEFRALSTRCPHQGTAVNNPSSGVIECPNHGSRFVGQGSNAGNVTQGPATTGLQVFTTTFDAAAQTVTISF